MIQTFFRLTDIPFGKDLPPQDLLATDAFTELHHRLDYMRQRRGLMLIVGEPGTGKTAAVRAFVEKLNPSSYKAFYVPLSTVTPLDFYFMLNLELGGESSTRKSTLFKNLQKSIRDYVENVKKIPILILDEAQYLSNKTLEELPILLNFRMDSLDPMILILIAHPPFAARLQRSHNRNLYQRILLQYQMSTMSEEQCRAYVLHHLQRVGGRENIFSESALLAIYANSGGLCRQVNRLATAALALGALEQKETLSEEDIYRATSEI